jgi:hypothetical protein
MRVGQPNMGRCTISSRMGVWMAWCGQPITPSVSRLSLRSAFALAPFTSGWPLQLPNGMGLNSRSCSWKFSSRSRTASIAETFTYWAVGTRSGCSYALYKPPRRKENRWERLSCRQARRKPLARITSATRAHHVLAYPLSCSLRSSGDPAHSSVEEAGAGRRRWQG